LDLFHRKEEEFVNQKLSLGQGLAKATYLKSYLLVASVYLSDFEALSELLLRRYRRIEI
jgi:hypothetical protein